MSTVQRSDAEVEWAIDVLRPMAARGIKFFPLKPRSKIPVESGYLQKQYRPSVIKEAVRRGCNVAVNIGQSELLVIDVDPRNGGDASLTKLQHDFRMPDTPTVWSGRGDGGRHLYYRAPAGIRLPSKIAAYPGIDFKRSGHVVAPGSIHPDSGQPYVVDSWLDFSFDIEDSPADLVTTLGRQVMARPQSTATPSISNEALADLLSVLDPRDYAGGAPKDWMELCFACYDATAGDGVEEFIEWCAGDPAYSDEHHIQMNRIRWASATTAAESDRDEPISKATLFSAVIDAGYGGKVAALGFDAADDFNEPDAILDRLIDPLDRFLDAQQEGDQ